MDSPLPGRESNLEAELELRAGSASSKRHRSEDSAEDESDEGSVSMILGRLT